MQRIHGESELLLMRFGELFIYWDGIMISYYMDLMGNIRIEFDCKIQSIVFCPKITI